MFRGWFERSSKLFPFWNFYKKVNADNEISFRQAYETSSIYTNVYRLKIETVGMCQ